MDGNSKPTITTKLQIWKSVKDLEFALPEGFSELIDEYMSELSGIFRKDAIKTGATYYDPTTTERAKYKKGLLEHEVKCFICDKGKVVGFVSAYDDGKEIVIDDAYIKPAY
ncbi:MAG: hypothetical protein Q7K42_01235, partial [Candidatus Diapherotrites archaeon]|nr:hypothetical protein [Candidatus Diapherotrites archaeon]